MVFEWLAREGGMIVSWWALATLAGVLALPLCVRLLGGLPDRGYTLARATGLLLVGYLYWLLASLGFVRNTAGSMGLAWLLALGLALLVYARAPLDWRAWWRENRPVVMAGEMLFLALFVAWAVVRAHQPELRTTEKPMDLMFISSIMRSTAFPPNDAWMAGYAISYYYFGYLLAAMLSTLSGVASTVGYNLWNALLFALTGLGAFGVVYNLARSRVILDGRWREASEPTSHESAPARGNAPAARQISALVAGLLGAAFVILLGNFQTVLIEAPYQTRTASEGYLAFWATQDRLFYPEREQARAAGIADDQPVTLLPGKPDPAQWDYWWWFRASRVLTDFDLDGGVSTGAQPIDEFPQFSFLLSDNHPHVMALPFVLLALGLALNLLLRWRDSTAGEILLYGLCVGGLIFLNTWDGPIYLLALVGADGLRRLLRHRRLTPSDGLSMAGLGVTLGLLASIFYLPFLIGFRSQAAGLLPNLIYPTLPQHLLIMFGPFIAMLVPFLIAEVRRAGWSMNWNFGLRAAGGVLVALTAVLLMLVVLAFFIPELYATALRFVEQNGGLGTVWPAVLARRGESLLTLAALLGGIAVVAGRLFARRVAMDGSVGTRHAVDLPPATGYALLLVALGLGLVLVPEFFYLRDNFGTRINTIFKFYYQAWVVLGLASGYAVYALLADQRLRLRRLAWRASFGLLAAASIAAGLVYPVLAIHNRMFVETGRLADPSRAPLTLDGGGIFVAASDVSAILCLAQQTQGDEAVVAEAVGGSYNPAFGRVAALTGIPIVLGWENHQRQWRGPTYNEVAGTRAPDLARLYTDLRWDAVQDIVSRYGIDYIFYGTTERSSYGTAGEDKFREVLPAVCASEGSVFYRVTEAARTTRVE